MADDRHVVDALAPDPAQPLRPLDLLEAGLDAGLGQLPGDDLARPHRVVVHRRDLQRGLEAVRVPRLREQALGPRDVVGHRPREVDVVRVQRIDVRAEELAHPEHHALQHLGPIDGVRDRAAHAHVREGLERVVHRHHHVVGGVAHDHGEPVVVLQIGDVLRSQAEERRIDVAGLERGHRRVRVGDEAEGHAVELRQSLHVVVGVLHQLDTVAAHPLAHLEGPGPDRRALEGVHRLARVDHRALAGEVDQEVRVGALQRERDGVIVLDGDVADGRVVLRIRMLRLRVHGALDHELHVGRFELASVVEAHPGLEEEGVVLLVGHAPALGQPRHDLAVAIDLHQALLDVVEHDGRRGRRRRRREIEAGRLRGDLNGETRRCLRLGGEPRSTDQQGNDQADDRPLHATPPLKNSNVRWSPSSKVTSGV